MNLFGKQDQPYSKVGTLGAYIARPESQPVKPGQDYFLIQIHSAQAAFAGAIWDQVKSLLVTSKVNLNHPILGNQDLKALQRSHQVQKNQAQQLGLSPNLISLVPASMTQVSVSIDFVLDTENRLAALTSLINSDSFLSTISLAPGASLVAKTISDLAQKVVAAFIPATAQQTILQFSGDFNLTGSEGGLRDGYYVILGTVDSNNPLPDVSTELTIQGDTLLANGSPVTQWSYVVLNLVRVPVRPRELSAGAPWEQKLREAEDNAQLIGNDPFADDTEKQKTMGDCRKLIQEASILLAADPNFLRQDSENIWKVSYKKCTDAIQGKLELVAGAKDLFKAAPIETPEDRKALGLSMDEDLDGLVERYTAKITEADRILETAKPESAAMLR